MRRLVPPAAAACALAALAWGESGSALAGALRAGTPFAGLASVRSPGRPPAVFLLVCDGAKGTVDIMPASAQDPSRPAPLFNVELRSGEADADGLRRALARTLWDPLYWLRVPRWVSGRARTAPGLSAYDAWTLAWAARRVDASRVRLSPPPGPEGVLPDYARTAASVEVLNASGAAGIAFRATKILRWRGVDVVHFGNMGPSERTRFIDRIGRPEDAEAARKALGCPAAEVSTQLERSPLVSLTLVLGQDYKACAALDKE